MDWPQSDPSLFIYLYIRKEAVLTSQIEGTQSSLSDLPALAHVQFETVHPFLNGNGRLGGLLITFAGASGAKRAPDPPEPIG